jgi:hypothetical protein
VSVTGQITRTGSGQLGQDPTLAVAFEGDLKERGGDDTGSLTSVFIILI